MRASMRTTRFDASAEEAFAVRMFLWVGILTTISCATLAGLALALPALF